MFSSDFSTTIQSGDTETFDPSPAWPVGVVLNILAVDSECIKFSILPLLIRHSLLVGVPSPSNGELKKYSFREGHHHIY